LTAFSAIDLRLLLLLLLAFLVTGDHYSSAVMHQDDRSLIDVTVVDDLLF